MSEVPLCTTADPNSEMTATRRAGVRGSGNVQVRLLRIVIRNLEKWLTPKSQKPENKVEKVVVHHVCVCVCVCVWHASVDFGEEGRRAVSPKW